MATTPIPLNYYWRNKSNGQTYWPYGLAENQTNGDEGQALVLYRRFGEQKAYARAVPEFLEKFERVVD